MMVVSHVKLVVFQMKMMVQVMVVTHVIMLSYMVSHVKLVVSHIQVMVVT